MVALWKHRGSRIAAALMLTCTAPISHAGDRATTATDAEHSANDTGRNARDRAGTTLTADKQSNDEVVRPPAPPPAA